MIKQLFAKPGGIKLAGNKALSSTSEIEQMPVPDVVELPLAQHAGTPAKLCVAVGQTVARGEAVGVADGMVSSPVHSSIAGVVTDIRQAIIAGGKKSHVVVIKNNGTDATVAFSPIESYVTAQPQTLIERIDSAGIVGLGGAAFPTKVKLNVPTGKTIDTLLVNGAECEPYLTADYRLMIEHPTEVIEGIKILCRVLNISRAVVGIEEHSTAAIESMKRAAQADSTIVIHPLPVRYPMGAEKVLIKTVLGREVLSGNLPADVGVIVQNVGTVAAIYRAVALGVPLIERVVTVSGEAIKTPKNLLVRIGTPIRELIAFCGGITHERVHIIFGGPIMGCAVESLGTPVVKGTSGIIVLPADKEIYSDNPVCINCGRCFGSCPLGLDPSRLVELYDEGDFEQAKKEGASDCCLCGACSIACPGGRRNSVVMKMLKDEILKLGK